jgi:hypothetical protein
MEYINSLHIRNNKIYYDYLTKDDFFSKDGSNQNTLNKLNKVYSKDGIKGLIELKSKYKKYSKLFQIIKDFKVVYDSTKL